MATHTTSASIDDFCKKLRATAADIKDRMNAMREKKLSVGIPKSAKYPNGKSVAEVAEQIEYGICDNGAPMKAGPRPFMRLAVAENKRKWDRMMQEGIRDALRRQKRPNLRPLMIEVGDRMVRDIQRTMMSFPHPVYDTGRMLSSISILQINNQRIQA